MLFVFLRSGAATTASRLGQPDLAIATLNDFVQVLFSPVTREDEVLTVFSLYQSAQMVCSLDPTIPVIADADTGYSTYPTTISAL